MASVLQSYDSLFYLLLLHSVFFYKERFYEKPRRNVPAIP